MTADTTTWAFAHRQTVTIRNLGLPGMVRARLERSDGSREYLVEYFSESQLREAWMHESYLIQVDVEPRA